MGQKIHPNGLRLGIVQHHLSQWFENKKNYSCLINEDFIIRQSIKHYFEKKELKISDIQIDRHENNNKILIFVLVSVPTKDFDNYESLNLGKIEETFQKKINSSKTFKITSKIVQQEEKDANIVGLKIAECLCNRIPFKRAIKETLTMCKKAGVLGVKIQVAGRLNGVEIARSEWRRDGQVPLHTLKAKIHYSTQTAHTIYGSIGVKVWLFLGEDQSKSKKFK